MLVTYDGSSRAAGVKIYINGEPQATDIAVDVLKGSIRTTVPLKVGQRQSSDRLDGVVVNALRIYGRALVAAEIDPLAWGERVAAIVRTPADKRPAAEVDAAFGWWLRTSGSGHEGSCEGQVATLQAEEAAIKARGTFAHVMHEKAEPAMAYLLYRGEYDKRRDPVKPDTPNALPPLPADLPKNRLGLAKWLRAARASAHGPGRSQPVLAGGLRHGTGPDHGRLRRHRRACPRTPSCSTGWPSSSASRGGTSSGSSG